MELKAPSMALKVLQGIGTAALIVILLDLFFFIGKRWRTILFAVGALGLAGLAVLKPSMFRLILSMSGGIVMPSIAAVGLCRVLLERDAASRRSSSASCLALRLAQPSRPF